MLVKAIKTIPGGLVMPEPFVLLFSQNLDYFRPYKNQVEPGYIITHKGNPIEIMVKFF